jgi:predicted neuraminidase
MHVPTHIMSGWCVTADLGRTWAKTGPLDDGKALGLIQPAILDHGGGKVQVLCRSRQGNVAEAWSEDNGRTWGEPKPTDLPNPNAGFDAVKLKDGRALLVYNHTPRGRTPLNVAVSGDGKGWKPAIVLEGQKGEYSYPAVIQAADGLVHVTYTWKRERVRHVVIDPAKLDAGVGGR